MRDLLQPLTDDELRVVAAGTNDLEEILARVYYHEGRKRGDIEEILSRIGS